MSLSILFPWISVEITISSFSICEFTFFISSLYSISFPVSASIRWKFTVLFPSLTNTTTYGEKRSVVKLIALSFSVLSFTPFVTSSATYACGCSSSESILIPFAAGALIGLRTFCCSWTFSGSCRWKIATSSYSSFVLTPLMATDTSPSGSTSSPSSLYRVMSIAL